MIKTVIFDIGNVLVDFGWEKFFRQFCPDEDTFTALSAATVRSPQWHELDRGLFTTQQVLDSFIRNAPELEELILKVFADLNGILTLYDYTLPWILSLKEKGLKVLVLSNFSEKFYTDCIDVMGFLKETDGGILSYRDKLIKPDSAIYELLLKRYHLKASECVFLDDLEPNVLAARKLGIHGIVFTEKEAAERELKKLGV